MYHFWKHFRLVCHHKHLVFKHCLQVGLIWQGLVHDLSKFSFSEFIPSAKYYQGDCSPCNAENKEKGYSLVAMTHFGRNKHHIEFWMDYNVETRIYQPVPMPLKYIVESVCDRMAASKTYMKKAYQDSHPLAYFLSCKYDNVIHPETRKIMQRYLEILADEGEIACFTKMRTDLKQEKELKRKLNLAKGNNTKKNTLS